MASHDSNDGFDAPPLKTSIPAHGVRKRSPINDAQTVTKTGVRGSLASSGVSLMSFFMKMLEAAQVRAAPAINALPNQRSISGISVFGDCVKITSIPVKARLKPIKSRCVNRSPKKTTARTEVNKGLKVITNDASPAAVYFIPYMNIA